MIDIKTGTIEERIIKMLQKEYPITVKELSRKLGISMEKLKTELLKLQSKNVIVLEPLPDKTFIRLIRFDIRFIGRRRQYKFIKKKKMRIEEEEDERNDIMYG
ncbi:MAG: winged helix-turn-helix domain-containing protein [Thermoplasmata archaeon]|nr:MAG: winged helix-turn-helix domain-containing protein [Thermoplasmata archaeon]